MIVRDYGSKLLLLLVFSMVGMVCCNAQSGKSLSVKKVMCTASPEGEAVPSLLDENGIEFQPLDVVNWKDYPCLLYTSPSPRDGLLSRMPSSA